MSTEQLLQFAPSKKSKQKNRFSIDCCIVCDSVLLLLKSRLDWILAWTLKIIVLDLVFNQENGYWMQLCTCASDGEDERKVVWLVS